MYITNKLPVGAGNVGASRDEEEEGEFFVGNCLNICLKIQVIWRYLFKNLFKMDFWNWKDLYSTVGIQECNWINIYSYVNSFTVSYTVLYCLKNVIIKIYLFQRVRLSALNGWKLTQTSLPAPSSKSYILYLSEVSKFTLYLFGWYTVATWGSHHQLCWSEKERR